MKPRTIRRTRGNELLQACQPPPVAMKKLSVLYQPVAKLTSNPLNPRIHSPKQIRQIAKSIAAFGFNVPILIDEAGQVIAGHGRVLACQELGIADVPTVALSHLSEPQKQAFLFAENRLVENAAWDQDLLAQNFAALTAVDLDFSLDVTGFDLPEIDLLIQGQAPVSAPDPEDAVSEPGPAVTRLGDLWILGDHRILCGNALDPAAYARLLPGEHAHVVFTDPPYNVRIAGNVGGLGKTQHREFIQASGEMDRRTFTDFLRGACRLMAQHSVNGALHYVCMDWRHVGELLDAAEGVYSETKNCCIWEKDNAGMGSLYRSQHEMIWVFKAGKGPHQNNIQLGQYGRHRSNIWHYPGVNSFGRQTEEGNLLALHPTCKPVALVADALMDASSRRDRVLDPFLGSGTTVMAAERVGRSARGIELDPAYVDVAVRRWQRLTHRAAVHPELRCTFDELAEMREVTRG